MTFNAPKSTVTESNPDNNCLPEPQCCIWGRSIWWMDVRLSTNPYYASDPYFRQVSTLLQCSVCTSISPTAQNNSCGTPFPTNLAIESLSQLTILSCHGWNFALVLVLLQCAACTSNSPTTQGRHSDPPLPTNLLIESFLQLAIRGSAEPSWQCVQLCVT